MSDEDKDHTVKLPHPDHTEPTVGACTCGWTVVYGWGRHGNAVDAAEDHIRDKAQAQTAVVTRMDGTRFVFTGPSL